MPATLRACQRDSAVHSASRDFRPSRVASCFGCQQMFQLSYLKHESTGDALKFTNWGSRSLHTLILSMHLGSKGQPLRGREERAESPRITGSFVPRPLPRSSNIAGMDWNKASV